MKTICNQPQPQFHQILILFFFVWTLSFSTLEGGAVKNPELLVIQSLNHASISFQWVFDLFNQSSSFFGFVDISLLPTFSTIYFDPLVLLSEEALVSPGRGDKGPRVVAHDVLLPQHGGVGGALGDQGQSIFAKH